MEGECHSNFKGGCRYVALIAYPASDTKLAAVVVGLSTGVGVEDDAVATAAGKSDVSSTVTAAAAIERTAPAAAQAEGGSATDAADWVRVLGVQVGVWGRYTPALNALLTQAAELNATRIIFQSAEVAAAPSAVVRLICPRTIEHDDAAVPCPLDDVSRL